METVVEYRQIAGIVAVVLIRTADHPRVLALHALQRELSESGRPGSALPRITEHAILRIEAERSANRHQSGRSYDPSHDPAGITAGGIE